MKKIILIFRDLSITESAEIRQASLNGFEIYAVEAVRLQNINTKPLPLEAEIKREINYKLMDQVLQLGDKNIDRKRLADHLKVDEFASIWYYHKFRLYFLSRNKHYEMEVCQRLSGDGVQITAYSDYNYESFPDMENIKVIRPEVKNNTDYLSLFHYLVFFTLRIMVSFFSPLNRSIHHMVIDRSERQPVLMPDLTVKPGNYNLEYLFIKFDKRFSILGEIEVPKFNRSNKFRLKWSYFHKRRGRVPVLFGEYILFRGFLSAEVRNQYKKTRNLLTGKLNYLQSNLNEPFEQDVLKQLDKLQSATAFFIFKYFSYKKYFSKFNLRTISSIDENSPSVKVILDAAKRNRIAAIGIQHGNIHDLHPAYKFTQKDMYDHAMPDVTLAWGEKWKNFLVNKANFPKEKVEVTGQVRTDIIPALKQKGVNIFTENTVNVVFASQPQRDPELRFRAAWDVFTAMKELGTGFYLYIKLHPGEHRSEKYYHSIAEKAGCRNYTILGVVDLYEVIASCEVLITCFSTVGTETVYFNKPLIILDHLKQDIQQYHRDGVAWQAIDSGQLKNIIESISSGKLVIDSEAYRRFIRLNAFKIDGKAADRVLEVINRY
ncbi:MAG: hypothetical protein ACLFPE_01890 [Bacteroidales bacterium]